MKLLSGIVFLLTLFSNLALHAEAAAPVPNNRAELELPILSVKLSNDGTGIIKKVDCGHCEFRLAKITANTQAFINGLRVNISQVAARAGKDVFITFDAKTGEVFTIRWTQ